MRTGDILRHSIIKYHLTSLVPARLRVHLPEHFADFSNLATFWHPKGPFRMDALRTAKGH